MGPIDDALKALDDLFLTKQQKTMDKFEDIAPHYSKLHTVASKVAKMFYPGETDGSAADGESDGSSSAKSASEIKDEVEEKVQTYKDRVDWLREIRKVTLRFAPENHNEEDIELYDDLARLQAAQLVADYRTTIAEEISKQMSYGYKELKEEEKEQRK